MSNDLEPRLQAILESGERLLWTGRPGRQVRRWGLLWLAVLAVVFAKATWSARAY